MDYKSIKYSVDQTSNPNGWKWTVHLGSNNVRTGSTYSRQIGLRLAEMVIEKALQLQQPNAVADPPDLTRRYAELQQLREQVRKFEASLFVVRKRRRERPPRAPHSYSMPRSMSSY